MTKPCSHASWGVFVGLGPEEGGFTGGTGVDEELSLQVKKPCSHVPCGVFVGLGPEEGGFTDDTSVHESPDSSK